MSGEADFLWLAIGWTMLHFLWVGSLIGVAAKIAMSSCRRASAEVRYGVALGSLALLAVAPAAIFWRTSLTGQAARRALEPAGQDLPAMPPLLARPVEEPSDRIDKSRPAGPTRGVAERARLTKNAIGPRPVSMPSALDALASRLPWLWMVGSPITFAWLALGLAGAERLRRHGVVASDGALPRLCRRLAGELGIARNVAIAACDRLTGPVLVGIVRPLILLPAAALGCWGPDQLEMVLLHELVHVRRWDNLANLLQRLVESALFFHPAVWIVSGWVRREREHCCDLVVVRHTGRARVYAEALLVLAGAGTERPPRAAVGMATHDLVGRLRRILDCDPAGHVMKLPLVPLALFALLLIAPAGLAISRAPVAVGPAGTPVQAKADSQKETPQAKAAADQPTLIQGKTIDQWLAALKDRDPTVREQAVEVLGERALDPGISREEKSRLENAAIFLMLSDKNTEVQQAASFFADLQKVSHSPERVKEALHARKNIVKPTRTPIRLVDGDGQPVAGAIASTYFQRDADREPSFKPSDPTESRTSNAQGELALSLAIPSHLDAAGIYAILQAGDLPIVGLKRVSREEIREGKPVTIVMHKACRVRFRVECPGLNELAEKYRADLGGPNWWRSAYVWLGQNHQAPRPLFTSSTRGQLEFLLPPGQFLIMAYGADVNNTERTIEVKPGHRLLSLGTLEVSPSDAVRQGVFNGYWRSIRRDARAVANGLADEKRISFRRPRFGPRLMSEARNVQDTAYSPDGTLLATAHWYSADPGEVKLWNTATGQLVASLPVTTKEGGVLALRFSPDGKHLAGSIGVLPNPQPSGVVVLWDVAGRRELQTLRGHTARITALAFAPGGRSLASGGEDRTVRFWDVASGRETGRIDGNPGWVRSLAYSPDGKALAIGSGTTLKLWDVMASRVSATLEPDGFWVQSVAFAPDGRTLAGAGTVSGPANEVGDGQVRLFDLALAAPVCRAKLTLHREDRQRPNDWISDVAFTPSGRQVAAVAMQTIVIWDATTGDEQDSLDRTMGSSADRLAISPDGHWLAVAGAGWMGVSIYDISPSAL